jgi:hypothetical protein
MGSRAACVVGAVLTYQVSALLALALVAGGIVLPWCAVLIANDRLPAERRAVPSVPPQDRAALPGPGAGRVIDA